MTLKTLVATSLILAGAAVLGTVVTDRLADRREAAARAAHPPVGQFVEVEGRRVHAVVTGAGPDLVLIHGANGSVRDFTFDLVDRLKDRYRVIAFDRPGLGYSDHTDAAHGRAFATEVETPLEQARLLSRAAAQLGAERPVVVGFSFGGIVAMAWALEHDPAAAVLIAGVANPWPGSLGALYRITGTSLGGGLLVPFITAYTPKDRVRAAIEGVFAPQDPPQGYADHLGVDMTILRDLFRANSRQVNWLRPHVVRMAERYDELDLPIELIHGDRDTTVPLSIHARPLSERLDNAKLTVLDGVGHMLHHSDPEAAVAAIDRAAERAGLR